MIVGNASATRQFPNTDWTSYQCSNYIPKGDVTGTWNFTYGFDHLPEQDCTVFKVALVFPSEIFAVYYLTLQKCPC